MQAANKGPLRNLGLAYIPVILGFYGVAIALISAYTIDRAKHAANLEILRLRADDAAAAGLGEIAPKRL